ncbi:hypothetical protein RYX36_032481 [Vicia faba]
MPPFNRRPKTLKIEKKNKEGDSVDLQSNDFDHPLFFEQARKTAEAGYIANLLDVDNLTR